MHILKVIRIDNLFGMFDHVIPISQLHKIAIIFSPNGFGKTNILKMLYHLYNYQFDKLLDIRFDKFIIEFYNGPDLVIKNNYTNNGNKSLHFFNSDEPSEKFRYIPIIQDKSSDTLLLNYVERFIPDIIRVSTSEWKDFNNKEYGLGEILNKYGENFPQQVKSDLEFLKGKFMPSWLKHRLQEIEIQLIDTKRLFTDFYNINSNKQLSVQRVSETIKRSIIYVRGEVESLTQHNESTFPFRLIEEVKNKNDVNIVELRERLNYISKTRALLIQVGILDEAKIPPHQQQLSSIVIDNTNKFVLNVYANDVINKFKIFEDLYIKITLFKEIIESQFSFKKIKFSKDHGIKFSMINPKSNKEIDIDIMNLSSGEQHLITLFFDLIFNTKNNSLILIDEPEISLHVAWQISFFDNLSKVAELNNLRFLIATHSPSIINGNWDCTIDLAKALED